MQARNKLIQNYGHNMPTQRAIIHIRPRWPTNAGNFTEERGLVKLSTGCSLVGIYEVEMHPDSCQSYINLYLGVLIDIPSSDEIDSRLIVGIECSR